MTEEEKIKAQLWDLFMNYPIERALRELIAAIEVDAAFPRITIPDLRKQGLIVL